MQALYQVEEKDRNTSLDQQKKAQEQERIPTPTGAQQRFIITLALGAIMMLLLGL